MELKRAPIEKYLETKKVAKKSNQKSKKKKSNVAKVALQLINASNVGDEATATKNASINRHNAANIKIRDIWRASVTDSLHIELKSHKENSKINRPWKKISSTQLKEISYNRRRCIFYTSRSFGVAT